MGLRSRVESRCPASGSGWARGFCTCGPLPAVVGALGERERQGEGALPGFASAARSRSKHVSPLTCLREPRARSFAQGGPWGTPRASRGQGGQLEPGAGRAVSPLAAWGPGGRGWTVHRRRNGHRGDRQVERSPRRGEACRPGGLSRGRWGESPGRESCQARGRGDAGQSRTRASSHGWEALWLPRRTLAHPSPPGRRG